MAARTLTISVPYDDTPTGLAGYQKQSGVVTVTPAEGVTLKAVASGYAGAGDRIDDGMQDTVRKLLQAIAAQA